ncbi:MAG TPA: hypothetical protein VN914_00610, partial [Polyangia bacterium]|nr:hypothetical protein [Polyangia bacterium]
MVVPEVPRDEEMEREHARWPRSSAKMLRAAALHRDQMPVARLGLGPDDPEYLALAPAPTSRWQFLGPRNLSLSGRVNGVAYAPSNPAIRYLASASGGVWKSTDNGDHWTPKTDFLDFPGFGWERQTTSVAVHPTNPNIVFVGTGDYDWWTPRTALGIIRSQDGGNTWQIVNPDPFEVAVSAIVIDPDNPQIVTATTGRGEHVTGAIHRSTDGGTTWGFAFEPGDGIWGDLEIGAKDASGVRLYYAVGQHDGGVIWRSSDRGATWQKLVSPWNEPDWQKCGGPTGVEVATSRLKPRTVYVAVTGPRMNCNPELDEVGAQFFKSEDAGATFTQILTGSFTLFTQLGYAFSLTCGGGTEDLLYAGGTFLHGWRSSTGFWQEIEGGHADFHSIAIHPANGNGVMFGNDGGVYTSGFDPARGEWFATPTPKNATLGLTEFHSLAVHPGDLTRLYGGTQDNRTLGTFATPNVWRQPDDIFVGDGGFTGYNPLAPNHLYAGGNGGALEGPGLFHSGDGGATFSGISPPMRDDHFYLFGAHGIDPSKPTFLYSGSDFLYRYNADTPLTPWKKVSSKRIANGATAYTRSVAVAKGGNDLVYTGASDGSVWRIQNAAAPSSSDIRDISAGLPDREHREVIVISVNPSNTKDILIGGQAYGSFGAGGLWRCSDTTAASPVWTDVTGSGPTSLPIVGVGGIARDPDDPTNRWYVATEVGVFYTNDHGLNWSNATGPLGLPNLGVFTIDANPVTRQLTVGTYGRGVWRIPLTGGKLPDLVVTTSNRSPSAPVAGNAVTFKATIGN